MVPLPFFQLTRIQQAWPGSFAMYTFMRSSADLIRWARGSARRSEKISVWRGQSESATTSFHDPSEVLVLWCVLNTRRIFVQNLHRDFLPLSVQILILPARHQ
jgi:hypothetical protein